jgi:hypothetical protein
MSLNYILNDALKKRVSEKTACLVIYKDLIPIHKRKTKGGFDSTALYKFGHKDRRNCVVALLDLVPSPIIKREIK